MGSRLVFLFPLVAFGTMGILGSLTAAYAISMICSIPMLYRLGIRLRKVDWSFLKKSFAFSAGNYMSEVFVATPIMIMPSIVLNTLGAADAAFYYIAYSLASILFILPSATTTSLFVEGSHGEDLSTNTKRTLTMTLLLLVPLIVGIYLFGDFVLGLVGKSYSTEGFELMVLFSLSAFFLTITQTFYTICRVRSDVKSLVAMSCLTCVLLIVLSLVFAMQYGLTGLGVGWLIGYGISAGIALLLIKARHLLT
jgi:O-antigen/teichoic acid export membrane protein